MILGWPWPSLWQGQICSLTLIWENPKILEFTETIEVYQLKGWYIYSWRLWGEYQRSRSLFDLWPLSEVTQISTFKQLLLQKGCWGHQYRVTCRSFMGPSNGSGPVTKMASMPIYGKNPLKIFLSENNRQMTFVNLVYNTKDSSPTKFVQVMTLCWP